MRASIRYGQGIIAMQIVMYFSGGETPTDRRGNITHCRTTRVSRHFYPLLTKRISFVAVCMTIEREKEEEEIHVLHNRIFEYSIDDEEWFLTTVPNILHVPLIFISLASISLFY